MITNLENDAALKALLKMQWRTAYKAQWNCYKPDDLENFSYWKGRCELAAEFYQDLFCEEINPAKSGSV